jgi:uncharacterized membrane protein/protein-disulfide isomerase
MAYTRDSQGMLMSTRTRILLAAFALLGLGAASTSSYVHHNLLTNPAYSSLCDINATVSCTQAYVSRYGSFMGVPVAIAGVIFFAVVFILAAVAGRPASSARENVPGYILALSSAGLGFAVYLAWASYFVLKVFCILCAITYVSVIAIFIIALRATRIPMTTLPSRAARDIRTLITNPKALVTALAVVVAAVAAVKLFPRETPPAAQAQASLPSLSGEQRAQLDAWWKVQPPIDLGVPKAAGAKVQIVKFSDYQCPGCKAAHDVLKQVLARYDRTAVEFVLKHYPLEGECNPAVAGGTHVAACEAAAAYNMARGTGFQQKLDDWLFDNQAKLTPAIVRQAAKDVAGIADFDNRYASTLQEVRKDVDLGTKVKLTHTPTIYLNGRMIAGGGKSLPPAQYVDALVDMELKAAR